MIIFSLKGTSYMIFTFNFSLSLSTLHAHLLEKKYIRAYLEEKKRSDEPAQQKVLRHICVWRVSEREEKNIIFSCEIK